MWDPHLAIARYAASHNKLPRLPRIISQFLGYRAKPVVQPVLWVKLLSIILATMAGMLCNLALAERAPLYVNKYHFPMFVPSFAATCILIYGAVDAPLSQPRNVILGHFLSGLISVSITKLFMTNKHNTPYLWIAAALSVACSSVVMDITGTVHPPSGATAVLPAINDDVRRLGWNYLPILLIHTCVFLGIALLCNNIARRYPQHWVAATPPIPTIHITRENLSLPPTMELSEEEIKVVESIQARL